jgi:hypothetical protein
LGTFLSQRFAWKQVLTDSDGLSHSEIDQACRDAIKKAILNDELKVKANVLIAAIRGRQLFRQSMSPKK